MLKVEMKLFSFKIALLRTNKADEAEIDLMVYELYGLTEEEMKVVEGVG